MSTFSSIIDTTKRVTETGIGLLVGAVEELWEHGKDSYWGQHISTLSNGLADADYMAEQGARNIHGEDGVTALRALQTAEAVVGLGAPLLKKVPRITPNTVDFKIRPTTTTAPTRQSLRQGIPNKIQRIQRDSPNGVVNARNGLSINKTEIGAIGDVSSEFRSISEKDALLIRPQTQRQLVRANSTSRNMRSLDRVLSTAPPEINPSPLAYRKQKFIQPGKHQHHEVFNMPFAEIVRKMYDIGDVDDVTNLHALMMSRNHATGDRLNALLMADPEPHLATHFLARKRGLELNRNQMRMKLNPLKTRQEVFEFVDNWLTTSVEPSKELFIKAQKDFENLSTQAQSELLHYLAAIRERGA